MADFCDLPEGIAWKIAADCFDDLEDVESFGKVCSSWRSETRDVNYTNFCASKNIQHPWLMLADSHTSSYRRFYSVSKGMYRKIDLPRHDQDPEDHRRYFSSKGWLIGVSRKQGLITFYDPFSTGVINPPSVPLLEFIVGDDWDDENYFCYFSKFIFSNSNRHRHRHYDDDDDNKEDDFQVAMIFDGFHYIAFWRPGQNKWIKPTTGFDNRQVNDACFFRGEFYAINHYSQVLAYGSQQEPKRLPRIVANLRTQGPMSLDVGKLYIVVSGISTLLVVNRLVTHLSLYEYETEIFELTEYNVDTGEARVVEDIGNRALFVGYNSTFFVDVEASLPLPSPSPSHKRGCRRNCIYFTDDNAEFYFRSPRGGGADMGIYSLEERKIIDRVYQGPSQFDYQTPPLWLELPHC